MKFSLIRANIEDAETLWNMQVEAFRDLLEKYRDFDTNPGNETKERIIEKLSQAFTYFYFVCADENIVGAVRVIDKKDGSRKRVAPIFIAKEFRNRGLAQKAFYEIEEIHGRENWELDTILQEEGNCYLYEKLGYIKSGKIEKINDRMDIVYYEKN